METKKFKFTHRIDGLTKTLIVSAPVENNIVHTNKFCPPELVTGGVPFISPVHGETLEEFIIDCKSQISAMGVSRKQEKSLDTHIGGLMGVVMAHIARCGRLIFGDLLIYVDIFSLLLEAAGFSDKEIHDIYPRVIRTIVELYPNYIFNTSDLSPFKGSHFDYVLYNISNN